VVSGPAGGRADDGDAGDLETAAAVDGAVRGVVVRRVPLVGGAGTPVPEAVGFAACVAGEGF
jgi:hypothetical protein